MDDATTEILMKLEERADADAVADSLNTALQAAGREDLEAKSWHVIPSSYSFIQMADTVYGFVALFFFILASSVIVNTTMMVIFERSREIGTVGAMGMTARQIVGLFFLEALYLGLIGALAGVILGIVFTIPLQIFGINFGASMEGMDFEMASTLYPKLTFRSTVIVYVYAVTISSLASLIPAARAARVKPVEALRTT
jgi:putative ABC transport system permease protein